MLEPAEVAADVAFLLGPGGSLVHGRAARDGQRLDRALSGARLPARAFFSTLETELVPAL